MDMREKRDGVVVSECFPVFICDGGSWVFQLMPLVCSGYLTTSSGVKWGWRIDGELGGEGR